ncbi:hypothetical protein Gogos_015276 [Gossypium gossypioides]|uniref:Ribulose bisphosphate carboxylase large subunit C-terminal domain-containing protein n=1 Tax=Gossypium gossypioides TaxID=34282 RepID=A0A7J9C1B8_GOSGO|nr:hypothetical protein [Gossypium gossypioides]
MSGGDHIHAGTVVGRLEGERDITLGFVDLLRNDFIEKDRSRGIYFTQDWVSMPGVLPVASGGIHVWHMPALIEIFGDDSVTIRLLKAGASLEAGQTSNNELAQSIMGRSTEPSYLQGIPYEHISPLTLELWQQWMLGHRRSSNIGEMGKTELVYHKRGKEPLILAREPLVPPSARKQDRDLPSKLKEFTYLSSSSEGIYKPSLTELADSFSIMAGLKESTPRR